MQSFLNEDFLLYTKAARFLFHEYAKDMPIFDYHCHLPVAEISDDVRFENLTRIWLLGDHYKWRAMRANGIEERLITGAATDYEKFEAWAQTVPKTLRNPLYHWTHLELKRYFGVTGKLLGPETAKEIYEQCSGKLQTAEFSTRSILKKMKVRVVCTTDDPVDTLTHHLKIDQDDSFDIKVLPAFRPDQAMAVENSISFNEWVDRLEAVSNIAIDKFSAFLDALRKRHDFFHAAGCRLSDHGLERPYAEPYTQTEISNIFHSVRSGKQASPDDVVKFKSAMLIELAVLDAEKDWTQQYHFGALRNTNRLAFEMLGPDTGYDSIGDFEIAKPLATFLDKLASMQMLTKTIIYNMNPNDNEVIASMTGNFQDGRIPGKIQFGSGWWFNDQKLGMERQINALSNMGLLSRFVGMLTDSRSFLSYPRHEYFRRTLCNLLGTDMENGEIPYDMTLVGNMVRDICYRNAADYFDFTLSGDG
ncbi:MAG: glucuronate isomerase [Deltaproteobacteria bacterium]|nr:glucuronate isomerase [Deltaproteobacteria bacterium]